MWRKDCVQQRERKDRKKTHWSSSWIGKRNTVKFSKEEKCALRGKQYRKRSSQQFSRDLGEKCVPECTKSESNITKGREKLSGVVKEEEKKIRTHQKKKAFVSYGFWTGSSVWPDPSCPVPLTFVLASSNHCSHPAPPSLFFYTAAILFNKGHITSTYSFDF